MDFRTIVVLSVFAVAVTARTALNEDEKELLTEILEEIVEKQSEPVRNEGTGENKSIKNLKEALDFGEKVLEETRNNDKKFAEQRIDKTPTARTSAGRLSLFNSGDIKVLRQAGDIASVSLTAEKALIESHGIRSQDSVKKLFLEKQKLFKEAIATRPIFKPCFFPIPICNATYKYRTANGECNNLLRPRWGKSNTVQKRFLPAEYGDLVNSPRTQSVSAGGGALPSARTVSIKVLSGAPNDTPDDYEKTVMVTAWGQFTDHDVTETPSEKGYNGGSIECCASSTFHRPQCFKINIDSGDPHFTGTCMNFVRSSAALPSFCSLGVRENINAITSFIDASNVYGSDTAHADDLRTHSNGEMEQEPGMMLPKDHPSVCVLDPLLPSHHCQKAGDDRVNEVPHLGTLHLAFVREHNRLAAELKSLNPGWSDEKLYQETRRIVGAIMQRITYNEWLPLVVGDDFMTSEELWLHEPYTYNTSMDPSIRNAFAAAAMRYGHSLIDTHQTLLRPDFFTKVENKIETTYFHPYMIFENATDIARWSASFPCKKSDKFFVKGVQDLLFLDSSGKSFDLAALNIQRGRDHGLPSYTEWRKFCGLSVPATFDNLTDHSDDTINAFKSVYAVVEDIDLFAGGISENLAPTANVGPTFACLLSKQFHFLKFGDRFWYQNRNSVHTRFTIAQINEIEKVTLAKVLCNNFELHHIQPNVFKPKFGPNDWELCSDLPDMNLTPWKQFVLVNPNVITATLTKTKGK